MTDGLTLKERDVVDAVLYALREGCFFPVPTPKPDAPVREWIQWGAMRNLHTKIAALPLEVRSPPIVTHPPQTEPTP